MLTKRFLSRGFTLIEVILVILILAVVAVVASSRVQNIPEIRAYAAVHKLQTDIRYAHLLAMETQARTRITFNDAQERYLLERETAPNVWINVTDPSSRGNYQVNLNTGSFLGVVISQVNLNGADSIIFDSKGLSFNGLGIALTEPASVTLNARHQLQFTAQTGKVQIVTL